MTTNQPLKIAIIGTGFTGVALAAAIKRHVEQPIELILFEKTDEMAAGDAYRTPFPYHLLNARVNDMSALQDDPNGFLNWLNNQEDAKVLLDESMPLARQFVPRILYRQYLQSLLNEMTSDKDALVTVSAQHAEVVDLEHVGERVRLTLETQEQVIVDKAVLAFGNNPPADFPFPVGDDIHQILNPWDYTALNSIPKDEPVLIVGTGLSMVDAVLTLNNQRHQADIYAVSRRGLLPLPHTENSMACEFDCKDLPSDMRPMMQAVRKGCQKIEKEGGDWRAVITQMRLGLQDLWMRMQDTSRKQFLRHVLPYWNIHRHRVHEKLYALLCDLQKAGQLEVMAGRLQSVTNGLASMRMRRTKDIRQFPAKHIINCMGSGCDMAIKQQPLLSSMHKQGLIALDDLKLGLATADNFALKDKSGEVSSTLYTMGPPMRGEIWECIAVPEIRIQCKLFATQLANQHQRASASGSN